MEIKGDELKVLDTITEKTKELEEVSKVEEKGLMKKDEPKTSKNPNKKSKKRFFTVIAIIGIVVLLILAFATTGFALINSNKDTILSGIYIRSIPVEGLTIEQAKQVLNEKYQYEKAQEIVLKVDEENYTLTPEQIQVTYEIDGAIDEAYDIGRNGNIFQNNFEIVKTLIEDKNVELKIVYDEEALEKILLDYSAKLPNAMIDNTYCIEDGELIITRGVAGVTIDIEESKQRIIENIKNGNTSPIELKTNYIECPEIDIDKIYEEIHSEPQNATYTTDPFEIIAHKDGVDFDKEQAIELLKEEKTEYHIKLIMTEPEILTNEIGEEAFPDLLGSYTTKFDVTNKSRANNVILALEKLNGVVVMPGEIFSYNKTLGKRTVEAGYDYAAGYAGGKVVPMLGGGICQVSSTLYDAVLYANLKVVERYNHMFQTQYIAAGRDATVVYGSLDFRFENTRKYPIMIKTKSNGGVADIKIFGIKEEVEYEIEIVPEVLSYTSYKVVYEDDATMVAGQQKVTQSGMRGCKTITYLIKKLNGKEVSKEVLSTDTYSPLNQIVKRGTKGATAQTNPTTSTPTSTKPETTPSTGPATPSTTKPSTENTPPTTETVTPEPSTEITTPDTPSAETPPSTETVTPETSTEPTIPESTPTTEPTETTSS